METSLFDYELPESLIAQVPAPRRDDSRLMVVERATQAVTHCHFKDLPNWLPAETALFFNDAAVFKARLRGTRLTGGAVECLLLTPGPRPNQFWCLLKPGKRLPPGTGFTLNDGTSAEVIQKRTDGQYLVQFATERAITAMADQIGEIPLPPYIERQRQVQPKLRDLDNQRYQTVYADPKRLVAAAAPTAGLHFTPEILQQIESQKIPRHTITLHIGLGTFQPIQSATLEEHTIHREFYEIPETTQHALKNAEPGKRVAVGTTTLRAIEDFFKKTGSTLTAGDFVAEADIFLYPPAQFAGTDGLITNFHLPRSTLVCLVASFLTPGSQTGISWLKELYSIAIEQQYRFYSYGDAMLIL